jgi:tetratricopeptide (TPR) repeat protein
MGNEWTVRRRLGIAATAFLALALSGPPALADKIDDAQAAFADFDDATALKLLDEAAVEYAADKHKLAVVYFNRGEVYASKGSYDQAVADFTAALDLPQDPNERAVTLISRAEAYNRRNRSAEALKDYDASLELAPDQLGVRTARGQLKDKMGDKQAALADYEAELKLHPTYYRALVGRAVILDLPLPPDPTRGRR